MLNELKPDIKKLINLSRDLGKYHEMLLKHNNISDKINYNDDKCIRILNKIQETNARFDRLIKKWDLH